ncbi:cilia- and flagella-associated protein 61 [Pholidichthys leucotaenia]
MRVTISSAAAGGREETVTVRMSECSDGPQIQALITAWTTAVFGRVNAIQLLEKANLAVTVADESDDVVAHASFSDHPVGELVDQADWETFLRRHFSAHQCSPFNTLFLHLFVAQTELATACMNEIISAVFHAISELDYIVLVSPHVTDLESPLADVFEPLERLSDDGPPCLALICSRQNHWPRLQIRVARVEDHDDLMAVAKDETNIPCIMKRPFFLCELMEAQNQNLHTAVCQIDDVAVGFMCVSADIDLKMILDVFDLTDLDGLFQNTGRDRPANDDDTAEESHGGPGEEQKPAPASQQELDLCIVTVPSLTPEFPLLQNFFKVPSPPTSPLDQEVYVLHRHRLSSVVVREAVPADRAAVSALLTDQSQSQPLLQDLDHFCQSHCDAEAIPLQAFVVQVDHQVVGVVIIRDEQEVEYIRGHYNVENFIYFSHHGYQEHARIVHFVLRGAFCHLGQQLFKEVLRLGHRSCLYYRMYPPHHHSNQNYCLHHPDIILRCSVPIRPRCQIVYPLEELGINAPSRRIMELQAPFALSLITRKLTMEPKVGINARLVVVGASDTGLSFLEVLCFCSHLRFNNLVLISTHGLPGDHSHEDVSFLSTSHAYSSRDLYQIPLHSCVGVVKGKMVAINKESKYVLVSSGEKVPYDHLILCTGLQYRVPHVSRADVEQLWPQSVPFNLFNLNDLHDCLDARHWLCTNFVDAEDSAIIYGNSLDVYTTVESLLGLGIRGSRIHLVLPPPDPGASRCFPDPAVEKAVSVALEKAMVRVHRNRILVRLDDDPVTSASFTIDDDDSETLRLTCGVFINLSNKGVDYDTFRSIRESFLVFDGRLVIDSTFHTNCNAIWAAGPLTKFSRRYHMDMWSHACFNSKEVGQDLATAALQLFDPTLEPPDESSSKTHHLVPLYRNAKIQGGKLPGGHHYLHFTKPTAADGTGAAVKPLQGRGIVTGSAETGDYFSLHLDDHELVETLSCLSLQAIPVHNYLSLYGRHQQLLGQLLRRYQEGLVHDLHSFFRQSCCLAVFHDRFSDFEQELQQIVSTDLQDEDLGQQTSDVLHPRTRSSVRSSAVRYLRYNANLLPMFALPGQLDSTDSSAAEWILSTKTVTVTLRQLHQSQQSFSSKWETMEEVEEEEVKGVSVGVKSFRSYFGSFC